MKLQRLFPFLVSVFLLSGCIGCNPVGTSLSLEGTRSTQPLSLDDTATTAMIIQNFNDFHSPVNGDDNEHIIFGALPVLADSKSIPADLAAFLGRWEGYGFAPPVKKDWKMVLFVSDITEQGGKLFGWIGTNLQYPGFITETEFRVVRNGGDPSIQFRMTWLDGSERILKFNLDEVSQTLQGEAVSPFWGKQLDNYALNRDKSFFVYKDYASYLAGKDITAQEWKETNLETFSQGYMVYLPEEYHADDQTQWPLILFLHGSGDRGDNLFLLAKASPFMFIREKGPLPAIIAAPLLNNNTDYQLFPDEFLEGALNEILSQYRVDRDHIYLTGLSLGGEATYRLAISHPDVFAAISPLCAFLPDPSLNEIEKIKDIPVWAIHGADDQVVKPSWGQKPVEKLKKAGGDVKFSLLPDHDHDVWTDMYSDPAFYEWMLSQEKKN